MPDDETAVAVEPSEIPAEPETPLSETEGEAPALEEQEETYETWLARLEAKPDWKTAHEARLEELRREHVKKGRSEAQSRLQPMVQQSRDSAAQAAAAQNAIYQSLTQAVRDGTLSRETVEEAWTTHRGLSGLSDIARRLGAFQGGQELIALTLGGELIKDQSGNPAWKFPDETFPLAQKYFAKWNDVYQGAETPQSVASDLIEELADARVGKTKANYEAKLEALTAQMEKAKGQTRQGQGTPAVKGTAGRSDEVILADPKSSIDDIFAARARQRATRGF